MEIEDRKILTEFLGLCWHERPEYKYTKPWDYWKCPKCGKSIKLQSWDRRAFDTWEDFGALWNKAKESKGWQLVISKIYYAESSHHAIEANDYPGYIDVEQIDKDRFPPLVLEAIKEGVL